MKFAPICPVPLMNRYGHSDYHMGLAHLFKYQLYRNFFKGADGYKILDTGVIEEEPVSNQRLIELGINYEFDEIILPDEPLNAITTVWKIKDFFDNTWDEQDIGLMAVPQGNTIQEWMDCYTYILEHEFPIDSIGIPKSLDSFGDGVRRQVCYLIDHNRPEGLKFHLLGIYNNPIELRSLIHFNWIRGCDSVLPIWLGQRGVELHEVKGLMIDRPQVKIDFEDGSDSFPYTINRNLRVVQWWCNGINF